MLNINVKRALAALVSLTAFSALSFAQPPGGGGGGPQGGPPEAALEACEDKSEGDSCSFSDDRVGDITGVCFVPQDDVLACAPEDMAQGQGGPR
jgi:hypothetical protein